MTFEKVKEIIVDTLRCNEDAVVLTASLQEDLGADSLDAVELNMALEEAFSISIPITYSIFFLFMLFMILIIFIRKQILSLLIQLDHLLQ